MAESTPTFDEAVAEITGVGGRFEITQAEVRVQTVEGIDGPPIGGVQFSIHTENFIPVTSSVTDSVRKSGLGSPPSL